MIRDPELAALLDQAARNLETLELLCDAGFRKTIDELKRRLQLLKDAYTQETDNLTQQVLRRAIERRRGADRRKPYSAVPPSSSNDS